MSPVLLALLMLIVGGHCAPKTIIDIGGTIGYDSHFNGTIGGRLRANRDGLSLNGTAEGMIGAKWDPTIVARGDINILGRRLAADASLKANINRYLQPGFKGAFGRDSKGLWKVEGQPIIASDRTFLLTPRFTVKYGEEAKKLMESPLIIGNQHVSPKQIPMYDFEAGNPLMSNKYISNQFAPNPFTFNPYMYNQYASMQYTNKPIANNQYPLNSIENNQYTSNPLANNQYPPNSVTNNQYTPNPLANNQYAYNLVANSQYIPNPLANNQYTYNPVANSQYIPNPLANNQYAYNPVANNQYIPNPVANNQYIPNPVANNQYAYNPVVNNQNVPDPVENNQYAPNPVANNQYAPNLTANNRNDALNAYYTQALAQAQTPQTLKDQALRAQDMAQAKVFQNPTQQESTPGLEGVRV